MMLQPVIRSVPERKKKVGPDWRILLLSFLLTFAFLSFRSRQFKISNSPLTYPITFLARIIPSDTDALGGILKCFPVPLAQVYLLCRHSSYSHNLIPSSLSSHRLSVPPSFFLLSLCLSSCGSLPNFTKIDTKRQLPPVLQLTLVPKSATANKRLRT